MSRGQQIPDDEAADTESLSKLTCLLEQLTRRYSSCSTSLDLGYDPGDNYDRKTEDGLKRFARDIFILRFKKILTGTRYPVRVNVIKNKIINF